MSRAQEKKFLISLLKKLDQPGTGIVENRFFLPALWVVLAIVFMFMFHLASQESLSEPILVIVAALIGNSSVGHFSTSRLSNNGPFFASTSTVPQSKSDYVNSKHNPPLEPIA